MKRVGLWLVVLVALAGVASAFRSVVDEIHRKITKDAIKSEFIDEETYLRVLKENDATDGDAKINIHALHFDSEAFASGTQKLAQNLNDAITLLSQCKKGEAIVKIGEALHALQDFYAHSTWVENHLLTSSVVPADIPICPQLVTFGADGFFSPGSLTADPNFADTCTPAPGQPATTVASGYYPNNTTPSNKCTHDQTNKDWEDNINWLYPSPRGAHEVNGTPLHTFAKNVATRHTQALWQDFKQAFILRYGPVAGQDYYNMLVKPQVNIAFVIDVSGSMADDLPNVKSKVGNWLTVMQSANFRAHLTLVTFVNRVVFEGTSCNLETFRAWIDALAVSGDPNGDCPEASLTAALAAAEVVGKGSHIVLATDARPREGEATFEEIKALLRKKGITCHNIWKDICGPPGAASGGANAAALTAEDVYPELAEISGGLSLPLDEMDAALDLILDAITEALEESASTFDFLCGGGILGPQMEELIPVPVDADVASIDFVLTSETGASVLLEVLRPNGALVQPTDPDVTFFTGTGLQVIGVTTPTAGFWVMRITGTGAYYTYVRGIGDTAIFDVTFLRIEEVEGSLPLISIIDGPLQLGETVTVEIYMIGALPALSFDLIRPDGSVIEPLEVSPDALGLGVYTGLYTPTQLIDRFYVRARDAAGGPFQRVLRRGFTTTTPGCGKCDLFGDMNAQPSECNVEILDLLYVIIAFTDADPCTNFPDAKLTGIAGGPCPVECMTDADCVAAGAPGVCVPTTKPFGVCCDGVDIIDLLLELNAASGIPDCPDRCPPGACNFGAGECCDQFTDLTAPDGMSETECFNRGGTYQGNYSTCDPMDVCP